MKLLWCSCKSDLRVLILSERRLSPSDPLLGNRSVAWCINLVITSETHSHNNNESTRLAVTYILFQGHILW